MEFLDNNMYIYIYLKFHDFIINFLINLNFTR